MNKLKFFRVQFKTLIDVCFNDKKKLITLRNIFKVFSGLSALFLKKQIPIYHRIVVIVIVQRYGPQLLPYKPRSKIHDIISTSFEIITDSPVLF